MSSEKHEHEWVRLGDGDRCSVCGIKWVDWTRGFGGNTTPMRKRPEPLIRPASDGK